MQDRLCFVQFMHPGKEHWPDAVGVKKWTKSADGHGRKYLRSPGRYLHHLHESPTEGDFGFWGEWEAPSEVAAAVNPPSEGPRLVHRPFWSPLASYVGLHNTDPFVFGDRFFYTGCLQHTRRGPTQLRNLSRGSVILFGSKRPGHPEFTIDTVFVVAHSIDHSRRSYQRKLADVVSATYAAVTLGPWYADAASCTASEPEHSFRLYLGATIDDPVDGYVQLLPLRDGGRHNPRLCSPGAPHPRRDFTNDDPEQAVEPATGHQRDYPALEGGRPPGDRARISTRRPCGVTHRVRCRLSLKYA